LSTPYVQNIASAIWSGARFFVLTDKDVSLCHKTARLWT